MFFTYESDMLYRAWLKGSPQYSVVQKKSSTFVFAAFLLLTNLGKPMHSPTVIGLVNFVTAVAVD